MAPDFKKASKCPDCLSRGYQLRQTNKLAGLGFNPLNKTWVSANGFSTGKSNLDMLIATAKTKRMTVAIQFLEGCKTIVGCVNIPIIICGWHN